LTQDELLHAMPVSIGRHILIDSIGFNKVDRVLEDFRKFYRVIPPNSLALHALIHDMDSKANLSLDERKKRIEAVKLAKLLQPIESDLDTGLLAILRTLRQNFGTIFLSVCHSERFCNFPCACRRFCPVVLNAVGRYTWLSNAKEASETI